MPEKFIIFSNFAYILNRVRENNRLLIYLFCIMSNKKLDEDIVAGDVFSSCPAAVVEDFSGESDVDKLDIDPENINILPLRGVTIFPFVSVPLPVGRDGSKRIVHQAMEKNEAIVLVSQKDPKVDDPTGKDLYKYGVIGHVVKILAMPDNTLTTFIASYSPVKISRIRKRDGIMRCVVTPIKELVPDPDDTETLALIDSVKETFLKILNLVADNEMMAMRQAMESYTSPFKMVNFICTNAPIGYEEKQKLFEIFDFKARTLRLATELDKALQMLELKAEINMRTREDLTNQQKEHFLRQQIRNIQEELGDGGIDNDIEELRSKGAQKNWPEATALHFEKELKKLERYNQQMPEYSIQVSYLETLLNLPWLNYSDDDFSLQQVQEVLDRDHYGLDKVKERIIEHMAVLKLRKDMKAPILCLFGPPGVGKTSLGRSIADALGREYARISLGGLHDEAEIRGHRKTYVGAMPGRILSALAKCGTGNPVFVLDEIDKIGSDFKGDPSQALLEVLDPEQNSKFHDNYVDLDYDLSKVMFIATANSLQTISGPLRDRMEIIDISGYIAEEKVEIAERHLIPKLLEEHGFEKDEIKFEPEAVREIIDSYTRESGVRSLDKKIAKVLRKLARKKASEEPYLRVITKQDAIEMLGREEAESDVYENNDYAGVVTGLAWTAVGGEILFIESSLNKGKGEKLTLTGNLGDVMKESAMIALQYLKAHADKLGIPIEKFAENDVHIHVPEGAIPKDGPSAGITIATSLASAFTGMKVRSKLAMTGEITLRGKVLPVGGIREKILAAKRAGITDIVLSNKNKKDVEEVPSKYIEGLTFHYVDRIEEVLQFAITDEPALF